MGQVNGEKMPVYAKIPDHFLKYIAADFSQMPLDLSFLEEISSSKYLSLVDFQGLPSEMPLLNRIEILAKFERLTPRVSRVCP
jgi:hypothetical protein